MTGLAQDVRHAMRLLRKSPGFTMVAVITLALGIGANTAIYSLLDQALLRSLPVREPNRLVLLRFLGDYPGHSDTRTDEHFYFSYPMYKDLRDQNSVLSGLLATSWVQVGVLSHGQSEDDDAELVSGNYFDLLGVKAALGRLLVQSDDLVEGANPVAVLSFNYWQRRFGLDPRIVNQVLSINGHPFTVVGIVAPGFHSVVQADNPAVFLPMTMKHQIAPGRDGLEVRQSQWLNMVGRLKPGLSREQAQARIDSTWHSIRAEEWKQFPHGSAEFRASFLTNSHLFLDPGASGVPQDQTTPTTLWVVMGMAVLMALMLCANIASLFMVRVARRTREISVRYALGARRGCLIQQLLAEGLLLGLAGGAVGFALAPEISRLLIRGIWGHGSGGEILTAHPDSRVLGFNFALALLVSVLFSLVPAMQFWRPNVIDALKQQAMTIAGGSFLRRASVAAQIGISLLLLVGAGLFVRTLHNLKTTDVGFETDHLIKFTVDPSLAGYDKHQAQAIYQQVVEKLVTLPGVRSAAGTTDPILANNSGGSNITIAGYRPLDEDRNVEWSPVSAGFFSTMNMPLLAGRVIDERDQADTQKVAIVNEAFARHFFGQPQNALGHYFCRGAGDVKPDTEIIGVVADSKHTTIQEPILRTVFTPYLQEANLDQLSFGMTFYVRTWQDPKDAEGTMHAAMQALDAKLVVEGLGTMQEQIEGDMSGQQVIAFLAASFGGLAILMAGLGIYGVLAFSTAQRTREIGIRIAMGASRTEIVKAVLAEVARLVSIGVASALPVCFFLARIVRSEVFNVSIYDPLTTFAVVGLILAVAFAAAALPARRAAKVDPMVALRYE